MSSRIQSARNKIGAESITIGYVPNKTVIQPLTGNSQGIILPSDLQVSSLTANGRILTNNIIADSIITNSITTMATITGTNQSTFIQTLSTESGVVNILRVKEHLCGDLSEIIAGKKINRTSAIDLAFVNKNKIYTFGLSAGSVPILNIYDNFNISEPSFLLSSSNVFRPDAYNVFAVDPKTDHLFYVSNNSNVVCYNLNTNSAPLSTGIISLGGGNIIGQITINNSYLYVEIIPPAGPTYLGIYDISNPTTLTFTGSCNLLDRSIVGVYDKSVITYATSLTSGNYKDLVGVIDTTLKHAPYRLNEIPLAIADYNQYFGKFKNYFYSLINDESVSACRVYFYDTFSFLQNPFRVSLAPAVSATLNGYENLGSKTFQNNRLYIASSGQAGFNNYPKGFSVWDFSNIYFPVSSFFWNDLINSRGPDLYYDNNQGTLLVDTVSGGVSFLQPFYTYNTNFDGLKVNAIIGDNFNTENINFINSVGENINVINIDA